MLLVRERHGLPCHLLHRHTARLYRECQPDFLVELPQPLAWLLGSGEKLMSDGAGSSINKGACPFCKAEFALLLGARKQLGTSSP